MKFLTTLLVLLTASNVFAFDYRCSTTRSEGYVASVCRGGSIPVDRTRNFSSQRLECTSSSDNYIRRPQKFDFNAWATNNNSSDPRLQQEAYNLRRALPAIQWSGTIPYETVEKWNWQACELHTSSLECGTHQECHEESDRECDHDKDGKETNCHDVSKQVCEDVANTCFYDVTYSEAVHCSNEVMNYSAKFERPSNQDWNPAKDGKTATVLPNKYDLLPGEVENIQTSNNSGSSTILNPSSSVVNHWNKYALSYGGSAVGAQCRQDATYDLNVSIRTEGRVLGKKGPNALRLPVDMEGKPVDVFGNEWTQDSKGNKLRPSRLLLADSSAAMIQSISEISRKNAAREIKKMTTGRGQNPDASHLGDQTDSLAKSFAKTTVVKIQLYKVNKYWMDKHASFSDVYTNDAKSVRASNNVLSEDQDIANSDSYQFDLDSSTDLKENIYRRVLDGLQPNRVYELRVSMYQKGIPFYKQSCRDDRSPWRCTFATKAFGAPFNWESSYFSDPLVIRFETPNVETRNILQRLNTFLNPNTLGPIGWLAEKVGHESTTGANK